MGEKRSAPIPVLTGGRSQRTLKERGKPGAAAYNNAPRWTKGGACGGLLALSAAGDIGMTEKKFLGCVLSSDRHWQAWLQKLEATPMTAVDRELAKTVLEFHRNAHKKVASRAEEARAGRKRDTHTDSVMRALQGASRRHPGEDPAVELPESSPVGSSLAKGIPGKAAKAEHELAAEKKGRETARQAAAREIKGKSREVNVRQTDASGEPSGATRSVGGLVLDMSSASGYTFGQHIEAKYRAQEVGSFAATWHGGVVRKVHETGGCDIIYDDGDREDNVPLRFLRLSRVQPPPPPPSHQPTIPKRPRVAAPVIAAAAVMEAALYKAEAEAAKRKVGMEASEKKTAQLSARRERDQRMRDIRKKELRSQPRTATMREVDGLALHMSSGSATGYEGVSNTLHNRSKPYYATAGRGILLGSFSTAVDAAVAIARYRRDHPNKDKACPAEVRGRCKRPRAKELQSALEVEVRSEIVSGCEEDDADVTFVEAVVVEAML